MKTLSRPSDPTPEYSCFENQLGRWLLVGLPFMIIGTLLGALTLVAALVSLNLNILGWLE